MKSQTINILNSRQINGKDLPWKFLTATRECQVIDFGRSSQTSAGFSILAQLEDGDVVELFFDNTLKQWSIKQDFLRRKMI
jgi:hypothetical protein